MEKEIILNGEVFKIDIQVKKDNEIKFRHGDKEYHYFLEGGHLVDEKGKRHNILGTKIGNTSFVNIAGEQFELEDKRFLAAGADGSKSDLCAPMPGKVLKVNVSAGEKIKAGTVIMVLEAMKMEHSIIAPKDGVIVKINFKEGDQLAKGNKLVDFKMNDKE